MANGDAEAKVIAETREAGETEDAVKGEGRGVAVGEEGGRVESQVRSQSVKEANYYDPKSKSFAAHRQHSQTYYSNCRYQRQEFLGPKNVLCPMQSPSDRSQGIILSPQADAPRLSTLGI